MHGSRCDPRLLGWTRLLDEWVVGVAHDVRSFAYREADLEPTIPLDDGTLRFELEGRVYRVAADQHWPRTADAMLESAPESIRCNGCAFSLPEADELDRYHYGNAEYPGALLLVQPSGSGAHVST